MSEEIQTRLEKINSEVTQTERILETHRLGYALGKEDGRAEGYAVGKKDGYLERCMENLKDLVGDLTKSLQKP